MPNIKNMKKFVSNGLSIIVSLSALGAGVSAFADSPITSTDVSKAYDSLNIPEINEARSGVLTPALAEKLTSEGVNLGIKVAITRALGWDINGKNNAEIFLGALEAKYGTQLYSEGSAKIVKVTTPAVDELVVLGYLSVLDNYFNPIVGIGYLDAAEIRLPDSLAVALVRGLVRAQLALDIDWCQAWKSVAQPLNQPEAYAQDIAIGAVDEIASYMKSYESYCQ